MAREPLLLLTLTALAGVSFWLARSSKTPGDAAPSSVTAPAEPSAAPRAAAATVGDLAPRAETASQAAPVDRSHQLELPDGTFVAALNGATDPKPLAEFWGSQIPWSPIVGVEQNDKGVAWYRHENGSYSTTETLWDSAGKRYVTLTRVAHQGPAAPKVATGG